MAIVLPEGHPRERPGVPWSDATARRRLRIGIMNLMPRLEAYEPSLLEPLAGHAEVVEPVFIRLASHGYHSSDHAHLARLYRSFDAAISGSPLDGLIVTGAPVEELAFEQVHYLRELEEILGYARRHVAITLGLCWGGLVIAHVLGIGKRVFARKLFGVYDDRVLVDRHDIVEPGMLSCAHSRHAGVVEADLESAARAGTVRALAQGAHTGYTMFETTDLRYLAHLGHPEYEAERLAQEWHRDRGLGRSDVDPPANLDAAAPITTWRAHRAALFDGLLRRAARGREVVQPGAPDATPRR